jgi:hypothetical protein
VAPVRRAARVGDADADADADAAGGTPFQLA